MAACNCGQHPHAAWCIAVAPCPECGEPMAYGHAASCSHGLAVVGVTAERIPEGDQLIFGAGGKLRALRRDLLLDARHARLNQQFHAQAYADGLLFAARKLREVLRVG